ncbi:hypothetical protein Dimus_009648 [Dionaea muscipula]
MCYTSYYYDFVVPSGRAWSSGCDDNAVIDRDDEDVYYDDESAEVVASSLRLGDGQGRGMERSEVVSREESSEDVEGSEGEAGLVVAAVLLSFSCGFD